MRSWTSHTRKKWAWNITKIVSRRKHDLKLNLSTTIVEKEQKQLWWIFVDKCIHSFILSTSQILYQSSISFISNLCNYITERKSFGSISYDIKRNWLYHMKNFMWRHLSFTAVTFCTYFKMMHIKKHSWYISILHQSHFLQHVYKHVSSYGIWWDHISRSCFIIYSNTK